MNWNNITSRRSQAKPRRPRNRGVERLNREIREVRSFLRTGTQTISELLSQDVSAEPPMESARAAPPSAGDGMTDLANALRRLSIQGAELRGEFVELDYSLKRYGQAYVELLEEAASRLDSLVMPARYRR